MATTAENKTQEKLSPMKALDARFKALADKRSLVDPTTREIAENLLPHRTDFLINGNPDQKDRGRMNQNLLASDAVLAARTCSSGLMANVTNPATPWFALGAQNRSLNKIAAVQGWLYDVNEILLDILENSNFYRQMPSHYYDVLGFGTAVTIIERSVKNLIKFTTLAWGSYVLGVNGDGEVDTIFRDEIYTILNLVCTFCKMDKNGNYDLSNLVKTTAEDFKKGVDGQKVEVTVRHAVYPNPKYDPTRPYGETRQYLSKYWETNQSGNEEVFLREEGFNYFPVMCSRWNVRPGEIYGRDFPAEMVVGDIKQLYKLTEDENYGIEVSMEPPLTGPAAVKDGIIDRSPGGYTPDGGDSRTGIRSLYEVKFNMEFLLKKREELKYIINKGFFVDILLALTNSTKEKTAEESRYIKDESMMEFGPVTQSFQSMLRLLIDVLFDFALDAGMVPPTPPEIAGQPLRPEFIGPFALAQKLSGLGPIERAIHIITAIAEISPAILDKFNVDVTADEISKILHLPPGMINADDVANAIRQHRAQAQAATTSTQDLKNTADAAQTLSETEVNGVPALDKLLSMTRTGAPAPRVNAA